MLSETVVRVARASIVRSSRSQPGNVRANLPFDPGDPEDLDNWMRFKAASSPNKRRYSGTDGWVVHSLVWDAKDAFRRARRRLPRNKAGRLLPFGSLDEAHSQQDQSSEGEARWITLVDSLAAAAASAAFGMVGTEPNRQRRSAISALTCIGRVFAIVDQHCGQEAAGRFLETLSAESGFRRLPLSDLRRHSALEALLRYKGSGNSRRDLAVVGLPWPSAPQWKLFRAMFGRVWVQGDVSGLATEGRSLQTESAA